MEVCHERWFDAPVLNKGNWRAACSFPEDAEVYLEIGCGKGKFCTETAMANPDVLYIALERDSSVILSAIEKAHALEIPNLFFVNADAQMLENFFDTDEIDRIYINFCDPWTRRRKPKRRLTYRDFLTKYKTTMSVMCCMQRKWMRVRASCWVKTARPPAASITLLQSCQSRLRL